MNNDGTFAASEMQYVSTNLTVLTPTGSITIPNTAALGVTLKMRLMVAFDHAFTGSEACTANLGGPGGENEDHFIYITCPNLSNFAAAASSTLVCLGNTATLTATGAASYAWSNGVTNGVSFSPTITTSYTVTGTASTNTSCPTVTANIVKTISVTNVPLTVSASTSSASICTGNTTTLSATGASNYTWTPGNAHTSSIIINPSTSITYTLTGFNTDGCPGTATVGINVKPIPTVSVAASTTNVCSGNPVTLTASGTSTSYVWSPGGQTGTSISVSPTVLTLYTATGTNSVNCINSGMQVILVSQNPTVTASTANTLVCMGGASTLTATGANTYLWLGSSVAGNTTVVNTSAETTYSVTGTTTAGCHSMATVTVSVFIPSITVSNNTAVCIGSNAMLSANGADTYTWTNNNAMSQNITVTPNLTTTYSVTGSVSQNGLSCDASNSVVVTVNSSPSITATSSRSVICRGESAVLTGEGAGATGTYTWTGGAGAVVSGTNSVSPIADQSYTISGTDANGCKGSASIQVLVAGCTGIPSVGANWASLLIYPNPSDGAFTMSSNQAINLHIIDELGQPVTTVILNGSNAGVNVSNLASGIYFVVGNNENGSVKQKIVVTH